MVGGRRYHSHLQTPLVFHASFSDDKCSCSRCLNTSQSDENGYQTSSKSNLYLFPFCPMYSLSKTKKSRQWTRKYSTQFSPQTLLIQPQKHRCAQCLSKTLKICSASGPSSSKGTESRNVYSRGFSFCLKRRCWSGTMLVPASSLYIGFKMWKSLSQVIMSEEIKSLSPTHPAKVLIRTET